jgi:crossover junction endodeoxyribonuclease RuvC
MQSKENKKSVVLGIDPGYERMGVCIIEKEYGKKESLIFSDCIRTNSKIAFPDRLLEIGESLDSIINEFGPNALAIENLFITNNQKTAMRVSETRGVLLYLSRKYGLTINEYAPMQIKTAITSYGKSDKKQMISMVQKLIKINKPDALDDEYDAIAVALTHLAISGNIGKF